MLKVVREGSVVIFNLFLYLKNLLCPISSRGLEVWHPLLDPEVVGLNLEKLGCLFRSELQV